MNENKFSGLANIYSKHRPAYPEELLNYLYNEVGLNKESVIADIGSGTGILTELLLQRNSKVFGVEPNDDMRNSAEQRLFEYKNFVSVKGSAEATELLDCSVDFVTVAQAFHWFDRLRFKEECKRILKPSGKVILIWNNRDNNTGLVMENEEINKRYCPNFKGFSGGMANKTSEEFADFFKEGFCGFRLFENNLLYDEQGFIGRNLSSSYAPKKHDENYNSYISALERLFARYSDNGIISLPTFTSSFIGEV